MTTPDELERVWRVVENEVFTCERGGLIRAPVVTLADLRLLLSERAELLAAVEKMRRALDGINELARDRLALIPADLVRGGVVGELLLEILARAALTNGEATTPNAGEKG